MATAHSLLIIIYSLFFKLFNCLSRILGLKHGAAGHEHVGTSSKELRGILGVHAAVNFDEALRVLAVAQFAQLLHLVVGVLDELLSAEAGVDRHEQHHVTQLHRVFQQAHSRGGIEHHAAFHSGIFDGVKRAVQMGAGLVMHSEDVDASLFEIIHITSGVNNHQMHVERFLGVFLDKLDDRLSEADVGHKHAVHHIDMEPVALAGVEHFNIALQIAEIGREK